MYCLGLLSSLLLAALSIASPVPGSGPRLSARSNSGSRVFLEYGKRVVEGNAGICDLSKASLPLATPALPPPSAGLGLYHIALGRGTQNYTCDMANATAVPVAAGAVASLFNVTCLTAGSPDLVVAAGKIAIGYPVPTDKRVISNPYWGLSGHHYFVDPTTAFFDLNSELQSYGSCGVKKQTASPAPSGSWAGPRDKGNGAVPWLKLASAPAYTGQSIREVYRVNTVGGQAPATCDGQKAKFQVDYTAEYWFYSSRA